MLGVLRPEPGRRAYGTAQSPVNLPQRHGCVKGYAGGVEGVEGACPWAEGKYRNSIGKSPGNRKKQTGEGLGLTRGTEPH